MENPLLLIINHMIINSVSSWVIWQEKKKPTKSRNSLVLCILDVIYNSLFQAEDPCLKFISTTAIPSILQIGRQKEAATVLTEGTKTILSTFGLCE